MRPGVTVAVTAVDRRRLGAIIGNRNVPQKHAWRAEIVLLTAEGLGTIEIMRRTGKSKTCVWRWQERFMEEGFDGLLRDKTRPARAAATPGEAIQALQRPGFRRQAARRRRALRRSTGPCHRALGRREEPNSGSRSHSARTTDEEGAGWHNDPRL